MSRPRRAPGILALAAASTTALLPALAEACSGAPAPATPPLLETASAVVTRPDAKRLTRVEVPAAGQRVEVCDAARVRLTTPVTEPSTQSPVKRRVPVTSIAATGNRLVLSVEGPVAAGAELQLDDGAVAVDGAPLTAGSLTLPGISPAEATFWMKALVPTPEGQSLLGTASYPAGPPITAGKVQSSGSLDAVAELRAHFDKMILAGFLAPPRAAQLVEELRAMLDGRAAAQARVFRQADGLVDARLAAATLANAGTVLEDTIDTVLSGRNAANLPVRIYVDRAHARRKAGMAPLSAYVWISDSVSIVLAPETRHMPLPALAALIGHEALHQDPKVGLPEELIASLAQFVAYAQHVLADPSITRWGTDAVRAGNMRLVALLNSGALAYPRPGLGAAPLVQGDGNIYPGSRTDWHSLTDLLRRRTYRDVKDVATPGNELLDAVAARMTGAPQKGLTFSDVAMWRLASLKALSWEQWVGLAHVMKLTLPDEQITLSPGAAGGHDRRRALAEKPVPRVTDASDDAE